MADYGCAVILDDFIAYDIATSLSPGHKVRVQAFTRSYEAPEVRNDRHDSWGSETCEYIAWRRRSLTTCTSLATPWKCCWHCKKIASAEITMWLVAPLAVLAVLVVVTWAKLGEVEIYWKRHCASKNVCMGLDIGSWPMWLVAVLGVLAAFVVVT